MHSNMRVTGVEPVILG